MDTPSSIFEPAHLARSQRRRLLRDRLARYGVAVGGLGVIIAILLIFFYLFYQVMPLFGSASIEAGPHYAAPGSGGPSLHLAIDELNELGVRYSRDGKVHYFRLADGSVVDTFETPTGEVTAIASGGVETSLMGLTNSSGELTLVQHRFAVSYPDDIRTVAPRFVYPFGEEPITLDPEQRPISALALRESEESLTVAAYTSDDRLLLGRYTKEGSMLDDEQFTLAGETAELEALGLDIEYLLISVDQRQLFAAAASGELLHFNIADPEAVTLVERIYLLQADEPLTSLTFLLGGQSLLASGGRGTTVQWFPVRDEHNTYRLQRVREFTEQRGAISDVAAEQRRRGFVAVDSDGQLAIYHSTAERTLLVEQISNGPLQQVALSPRANYLLAESVAGELFGFRVENEHPEVSMHSLWGKVHYEGYAEADYMWQSSSASNDFEPKFSLTPLAFGTLKAAFYAMLFAIPLGILGAIYTAYFMEPRMRQVVKPTIEVMEALPTVILGFLAGLWLAPFIENYLPGVFALLLIMPLGILMFGFLWRYLPDRMHQAIPEGWEAVLLIPVVIGLTALSISISLPLEAWLFDGDMRTWLYNDLGIGFDQRNSLVVGMAMGFAVIPTIFSITEDAIFGVPKHLTFGSLALGASRWQTLSRVVILTASPGIFSAVMIGFGRAIGETMIVLMATGNTPLMDFNIFEGMRTLSANIAVEMPESEVGSSHFRILFLAALVLFLFTFVFNTAAEIVRHRLRKKYSSL